MLTIGDKALCSQGILGVITRIGIQDAQAMYYGYRADDPSKKWQSKQPVIYEQSSGTTETQRTAT